MSTGKSTRHASFHDSVICESGDTQKEQAHNLSETNQAVAALGVGWREHTWWGRTGGVARTAEPSGVGGGLVPSVALLLSFFGAEMPPGTTPGSLRAHPPEVSPAPLSSSQMIHSSHHPQTRSFGSRNAESRGTSVLSSATSERVNLNAQPKKKTNAQTKVKGASKCAPCEERKI